jgi:hypothetical protein
MYSLALLNTPVYDTGIGAHNHLSEYKRKSTNDKKPSTMNPRFDRFDNWI